MPWQVGAARNLPLATTSSWDGAAAKARIFSWAGWPDNPSPSKAKRAFLFWNSDEGDLKGSYKCPFADVIDGSLKATTAGVIAAGNRIDSTDVPSDLKGRGHSIIDAYKRKGGIGAAADKSKESLVLPYTVDARTGLALLQESFVLPSPHIPVQTFEYLNEAAADTNYPTIIFPMFHALRAERVTRNKTFYMEDTLRGNPNESTGMYSLVRPYPIPFIKDHATGGGFFGGEASEIYGRVVQAFMVEGALDNAKALSVVLGVADPYAIRKILEGSWRTVSMGSRAEEVFCSLCDHNILDDPCEHTPEDEGFYAKIGPKGWRGLELSAVTVPSDPGAQIKATNLSPDEVRMYASNPNTECVYDLSDPLRINILDHDEAEDHSTAVRLYNSSSWLVKEFAAQRKKYFMLAESVASQKGTESMTDEAKRTPIANAVLLELPNESFGIVYTDEQSKKQIRRFPLYAEMTQEERAYVSDEIAAAKNITPEQREKLEARVQAADLAGETLEVPITAESYTNLLDIIDELRNEADVWANAAAEPQIPPVEPPVAAPETNDVDVSEYLEQIRDLEAAVQTERDSRASILASVVARYQVAAQDSLARGRTVEQLEEFYGTKDVAVLETLYELIEPSIAKPTVDVGAVEHVDNPLEQPVEGDAPPVAPSGPDAEKPAAPEAPQEVEKDEDDDFNAFLRFGPSGFERAASKGADDGADLI